MENLSSTLLLIIVVVLVLLSGFFSAAETGVMSINRYRLRHLARRKQHGPARRIKGLLERPDRLLGLVLIGNTFANIFASAAATIIVVRSDTGIGVGIATILLTAVVLIFSEIAPKTLAAVYPEKIAFFCSIPLVLLMKILYPVIWLANLVANNILRLMRVQVGKAALEPLSPDELRTVLREAGGKIPVKHQSMLLGILDLGRVTVEDIMVPRSEIVGIDLANDWDDILNQLSTMQHTRLPVYEDDIENIHGVLHTRVALSLLTEHRLTKENLLRALAQPYFVPEATSLNRQLLHFQRTQTRIGLVVDEYGDIQGLVTLEDILEEVVGEFTTDFADVSKDVHPQEDGCYLVDGTISLRKLNRIMNWHFPTNGPKTLNGIIVEYLEDIPRSGTCLKIAEYPLEIIQVKDNIIKTVKIMPRMREQVLS